MKNSLIAGLILLLFTSACAGVTENIVIQVNDPSPDSTLTVSAITVLLTKTDGFMTDNGPAYSLAWSPNGDLLAVADFGQVKIWYADTGELLILAGNTSYVWGVAWSSNGEKLAATGRDGSLRIWDLATSSEADVFESGPAYSLSWSPDGSHLAVGTAIGEVKIVDLATLTLEKSLQQPIRSAIISIGWSPDGVRIAAGYLSGELIIWDPATGEAQVTIRDYTTRRSDTNGLAWSPDGDKLASAHQDGNVRVWDPVSGELLMEIDAHNGWARGIAWSPDGEILASTGSDRNIVLSDARSGIILSHSLQGAKPIWSVAWSPDGEQLAAGNGTYDTKTAGMVIICQVER